MTAQGPQMTLTSMMTAINTSAELAQSERHRRPDGQHCRSCTVSNNTSQDGRHFQERSLGSCFDRRLAVLQILIDAQFRAFVSRERSFSPPQL